MKHILIFFLVIFSVFADENAECSFVVKTMDELIIYKSDNNEIYQKIEELNFAFPKFNLVQDSLFCAKIIGYSWCSDSVVSGTGGYRHVFRWVNSYGTIVDIDSALAHMQEKIVYDQWLIEYKQWGEQRNKGLERTFWITGGSVAAVGACFWITAGVEMLLSGLAGDEWSSNQRNAAKHARIGTILVGSGVGISLISIPIYRRGKPKNPEYDLWDLVRQHNINTSKNRLNLNCP